MSEYPDLCEHGVEAGMGCPEGCDACTCRNSNPDEYKHAAWCPQSTPETP